MTDLGVTVLGQRDRHDDDPPIADPVARIDAALELALTQASSPECPPGLASAVRYAVFPGGARIRPKLCLAVAAACGDDAPKMTDAAACSIEFMHCASLVHDDLPCFDDAPTRRGKPSVHSAFGERLAVLAGDALIVLAYDVLARSSAARPERLVRLLTTLGGSVGIPSGIVAGQAWECETAVSLENYHRSKTGSLFVAATMMGAAAAGANPALWQNLGQHIGEAYQVADDIRDAAGNAAELGKPVGRDVALARPSAVRELGLPAAVRRLEQLVAEAIGSIPDCAGAAQLHALIRMQAKQFLPKDLMHRAA